MLLVKSKEKSTMNVFWFKKQDSSKRKLDQYDRKQMKLLADMYINQMKINKLNKELDILKEDYAKWSWES
jgi:hypothetical protein